MPSRAPLINRLLSVRFTIYYLFLSTPVLFNYFVSYLKILILSRQIFLFIRFSEFSV